MISRTLMTWVNFAEDCGYSFYSTCDLSNTRFEVILGGVWRCSAILEDCLSMNKKGSKNLITTRKHCVYKAFGAYKTNYEI